MRHHIRSWWTLRWGHCWYRYRVHCVCGVGHCGDFVFDPKARIRNQAIDSGTKASSKRSKIDCKWGYIRRDYFFIHHASSQRIGAQKTEAGSETCSKFPRKMEVPKYIWMLVFRWLSLRDLFNMEQTCKRLHGFLNDDAFWKVIVYRELASIPDFVLRVDEDVSFRQQYVEYHRYRPVPGAMDHFLRIAVFGINFDELKRIAEDWGHVEKGRSDAYWPHGGFVSSMEKVVSLRRKNFRLM